jgi:hypothetical protein
MTDEDLEVDGQGEVGRAPDRGERADSRDEVSIRARFERFPATVKGAFVIRGEDANPHQVSFHEARVVRIGGGTEQPIAMKEAIVHAPPHQDVFLPFEFSITDLGPGWYGLEADMDIDGDKRTFPGGRTFAVAWPRAASRRGTVTIDQKVETAGGESVHLAGLECNGDHTWLRYETDGGEPVSVGVVADGELLSELDSEFDAPSGSGRIKTYPILRAHRRLRIHVVSLADADAAGNWNDDADARWADVDLP